MTGTALEVTIGGVYESPEEGDGFRVLVDRLWPRGPSRASAALDLWARELFPSAELRRCYAHDLDRYPEFREHYLTELDDAVHVRALADLLAGAGRRILLLTATKDVQSSQARVLAEHLRDRSVTPVGGAGTAEPTPHDVDAS